jgi:sulfate adenylyltransferase (ADP) / ATP adenylyltransferase
MTWPDPSRPFLAPDRLWDEAVRATERALASGVLQPIATDCQRVEQAGVAFQVRVLGRLHLEERARGAPRQEAEAARQEAERPQSPFEAPEPDLLVGELSPTHRCLLNKFPVVEHHLLITTRAFEEQEMLLTDADFAALARCMAGVDGLAFYNSGERAGASQRHKHLQLIPPLGPQGLRAPMEELLSPLPSPGSIALLPGLPFPHVAAGLALRGAPMEDMAAQLAGAYRALCGALGFGGKPPPYNLLATRDWMLLVPRIRAEAHGINVNAMGFAGSLLVRSEEQLQHVRTAGPLSLLCEVSAPQAA